MAVLESIHEDEDLGAFPAQLVTVAHFETLGDIQRYRLTLRHGLVYQNTMLLNEYADPDFETAIQAAASRVNQSGRYFETPETAAEAVFAEYETAPQQAQSAPPLALADFIKKHPEQFKQENGEWQTAQSPQDFCFWLTSLTSKEIPPVETVADCLKNKVSLETWKRYYRDAALSKKTLRAG